MIRGVIFDFGGLVIDSEGADCLAWCEEFAHAGVSLTRPEYAKVWDDWAWQRTNRIVDHLEALVGGPVDRAGIEARRLGRSIELTEDLHPRSGIREWIIEATTLGLKCAVAADDDTGLAMRHLQRLGLDSYLDAVVVLDRGLRRKPAPDIYEQALRLLDLPPQARVAVEDSGHGVEAAHRAGMRAIVYPTSSVSEYTDLSSADLIVSAAETSLADALQRLAG